MNTKGAGSASFILIALILSLTCFGMLALYSVRSEKDSLEKTIQASQMYYQAQKESALKLRAYETEETYPETISIPMENDRKLVSQLEKVDGHIQIADQYIESIRNEETNYIDVWDGKE